LITFIEPISKNIGMYVPAYPLPIMEIASFVKKNLPKIDIEVISVPIDYGLPLSEDARNNLYSDISIELCKAKPRGVGISCTAISQAEEAITLCEHIKRKDPDIFTFMGGYFPTIYYEDILKRTSSLDLIVVGEGEAPSLEIISLLEKGKDPRKENIESLAWKEGDEIRTTKRGARFDLKNKAVLNLDFLRNPGSYEILPYSFSRGCPFQCNFCMEEFIRPTRIAVPEQIVYKDLENISARSSSHTLLVSDALFRSFGMFPFIKSLGMKVNFETRCDVMESSRISEIADTCGMFALGFESASYDTLKRMNKVRDKAHYEHYISNTIKIFREAARNEIPLLVFMIAGYPGDTERDLEKSLAFAHELSKYGGEGGYIFKIGECQVYPKTNIHRLALSIPDVVFDDDGVFGMNTVRKPSKDLDFDTVQSYTKQIFSLSNYTPKLKNTLLRLMPFFRLPVLSLKDEIIPDSCYMDSSREIMNVRGEALAHFRTKLPQLSSRYKGLVSAQRNTRILPY